MDFGLLEVSFYIYAVHTHNVQPIANISAFYSAVYAGVSLLFVLVHQCFSTGVPWNSVEPCSASGIQGFRRIESRNGSKMIFVAHSHVFWALSLSKMHLWSGLYPKSRRGVYSISPDPLVDGRGLSAPTLRSLSLLSAFGFEFRPFGCHVCPKDTFLAMPMVKNVDIYSASSRTP